MIWANCFFSFNMSFLLRKVEDVTTISKSQSLTSVSNKRLHLESSKQNCYIISLRAIIQAIFTSLVSTSASTSVSVLVSAFVCLSLCCVHVSVLVCLSLCCVLCIRFSLFLSRCPFVPLHFPDARCVSVSLTTCASVSMSTYSIFYPIILFLYTSHPSSLFRSLSGCLYLQALVQFSLFCLSISPSHYLPNDFSLYTCLS